MKLHAYLENRRLRRAFSSIGKNVIFDPLGTYITPELTEIGDNVFIGERPHFSGPVTIEDNVMFGPRVMLLSGNHKFGVRGESPRFLEPDPPKRIVIGRDAWLGAGVIVLDGVKIGEGAVIGAGSVVTKEIPPFVVAVGNPCRPIRNIFEGGQR
jgi:maltose O-acetyltransferase